MVALDFNTVQEITRRVYEYAYGIDTRDWALYRSIFTDQITMDFSSYSGVPKATLAAQDWVANVKVLFTGLDATQHSMSNPLVDAAGAERARCRMYMQAKHILNTDSGDNDYTLGGYYDDELVLTDNGWRITAVTLNVTWHRGNRQIMDLAAKLGAQKLAEK